ncbi:MAG TPA: TolC family protein [Ohtaekwangia sp.]
MKTNLLACTLLVFTAFLSVRAQQTDSASMGKAWTLRQCVDYAWAHNLTVRRSELTVEETKVAATQSKFSRLPTVNGQASYGYSWGRGLDPVTNLFTEQEIQSSNVGVQGSLPLINGLNIHNTSRQNQQNYKASEYDLAKSKNDVALSVASLFINVVFNKEQLENAKFLLASSQQQLDRTKKQVAAGALARSEELNMEAQVATNELTVVQRENALALSVLQLKQGLQIPASEPFDVVIPELNPEDMILGLNRDEVYDIAKQTMPEIQSAKLKVEGSNYGVKASRGDLFPRLSLVGSIQTNYSSTSEPEFYTDGTFRYSENPTGQVNRDVALPVYATIPNGSYRNTNTFQNQFEDNVYRTLSLQLTIPIFNSYQSRATYQRSLINQKRAEINEIEVGNTLRQNVETSYNDALAASKTYNSSLKQVLARDEAYRMTKQRFEIGAANYVDYFLAENELYRAKSDLVRAKYDFIFKKKVLDFYQGKPLDY